MSGLQHHAGSSAHCLSPRLVWGLPAELVKALHALCVLRAAFRLRCDVCVLHTARGVRRLPSLHRRRLGTSVLQRTRPNAADTVVVVHPRLRAPRLRLRSIGIPDLSCFRGLFSF